MGEWRSAASFTSLKSYIIPRLHNTPERSGRLIDFRALASSAPRTERELFAERKYNFFNYLQHLRD